MFTKQLPTVFVVTTFFLLTLFAFQSSVSQVVADVATHIVISEIQVGGSSAGDEFVELYNPTDTPVDVTGWRLHRQSSGASNNDLVASMSGTIPAHGYYLIAPDTFDGGVEVDQPYSASTGFIAADNAVSLFNQEGSLIDRVGFGEASLFEASAAANPASNGSIERKAFSTSTSESMAEGGSDENSGNGEDTDNNQNDFVLREESQPQNASMTEVPVVPSPTTTPSPTATASPSPSPTATPEPTVTPDPTVTPSPSPTVEPTMTPTPSPSPTLEPTATPEPTVTPSPTPTPDPTVTPSPSPTVTPTPTAEPTTSPTAEPTATPSPTPTASPSPTPTATPEPGEIVFQGRLLVCRLNYLTIRTRFTEIRWPVVRCSLEMAS